MYEDGSIEWIDKLYVEWHGNKSIGFDMKREYKLQERLENTFGNRVWFGWIEGDMARARSTMPQTKDIL